MAGSRIMCPHGKSLKPCGWGSELTAAQLEPRARGGSRWGLECEPGARVRVQSSWPGDGACGPPPQRDRAQTLLAALGEELLLCPRTPNQHPGGCGLMKSR
ncbi:unnamed protein product [Lepidochelys kempii]